MTLFNMYFSLKPGQAWSSFLINIKCVGLLMETTLSFVCLVSGCEECVGVSLRRYLCVGPSVV